MDYIEFKKKFNIRLNAQQETAVRRTAGAALLLAVPGSGKTTVLVTRLGYMLYCEGVDPRDILTMTYTVAAAGDMKRRFIQLFGDEFADRLSFRTINSVCAEIVAYYARVKGTKAFALEDGNAKLLSDIFHQVSGVYASESDIKDLRSRITYVKNMMLTDEQIDKIQIDNADFPQMYRIYTQRMRQRGLMDYDDQMVYARTVLRRYPDILAHFRAKCRRLCVDEAQDTSKIQHDIIRILAGESGSIFMVGDEDQSIYGFRAAYPTALLNFEKTYSNAAVLLMEKNYRSTENIAAAADSFIQRNTLRHKKHIVADRAPGAPVRRIEIKSRRAQYAYIAKLAENCDRETAVLYRNNDSAVALIDILQRRGISYRCRGVDSSFFSHYIVRDISDIIYFASNPYDRDVFEQIYYKLGCRISKSEMQSIDGENVSSDGSLLLTLAHQGSFPKKKLEKIEDVHNELMALRCDTPAQAIARIRYSMGYGGYILTRGGDMEKLNILTAVAGGERSFDGFFSRLEELRKLIAEGAKESDSLFNIGTIHSAKGLEYDRVVIMDAVDGILPAVEDSKDPEEKQLFEEERRLFYVGATRAKNELILLSYGDRDADSTFVDEFCGIGNSASNKRAAAPPQGKLTMTAEQKNFMESLSANTRIIHTAFGSGVVMANSNNKLKIAFDSCGIKEFAADMCVVRGLVEIE